MLGEVAEGEGPQYFKFFHIGTVRGPMMVTAKEGETYNYDVATWGEKKIV